MTDSPARPSVDALPGGHPPSVSTTNWLKRVPLKDPVDRRNAPMLQVVLLLLGVMPPLLWAYRALLSDIPWRPGEGASMFMGLLISAIALFGVLLIWRGRLQWALRQMLVVAAVIMVLAHATGGNAANNNEQYLLVVWMVLAGLMIGRRALWLMYAAGLLALALGGISDAKITSGPLGDPWNVAVAVLINALVFLLIAVVVDRSVCALRESLAEAVLHSDALQEANRRLEAEMAARDLMYEQLIHAQKVESVGRMASGIVHDFNNLLSLILGYAAKGRQSTDLDQMKLALVGVEEAGRRATAVTRQLLDFSRRDFTRIERFDAVQALRELQPMLRQLFDPRIHIEYDLPAVEAYIEFDQAQLDLVVLNIAANANDAMPDGGRFEVVLRPNTGRGYVELMLKDSGQGMTDQVRQRIFEPFFTTKPREQGSGLGLAVASQLLLGAGGDISVLSELGKGTVFILHIFANKKKLITV